jgi:AcrR family transcriptional regulator
LHFADRRTLINAVLARTASRFVASSEAPVRRRRTLAGQVAEAAVFIRTHLGDNVLTLRLPADEESVFATLLTSRLDRLVEEWVEFWLPFLADAQRRREIRAGVDHRQAAEWIVRMMLSFAVMPSVSFEADRPEEIRRFVRSFVVDGLAPHPK